MCEKKIDIRFIFVSVLFFTLASAGLADLEIGLGQEFRALVIIWGV